MTRVLLAALAMTIGCSAVEDSNGEDAAEAAGPIWARDAETGAGVDVPCIDRCDAAHRSCMRSCALHDDLARGQCSQFCLEGYYACMQECNFGGGPEGRGPQRHGPPWWAEL